MTARTKSAIIFFTITTVILLGLAYMVAKNIYLVKTADHYRVTNTAGAVVRASASGSGETLTTLTQGHRLTFDSISGAYGVIRFNNKPAYVRLTDVALDTVTGIRPGPGQHAVDPRNVNDFWTTNNIVAAFPDFGFLRGKVSSPDLWFWAAVFLLLISFALGFWAGSDLRTGTIEWKLLYITMIGTSVCQFVYITGSPEPLSFFSPDVVGWTWAVIHFLLVYVGLSMQLDLLCRMIHVVQDQTAYNFLAGGLSYFIWGGALVVAGLFLWDWFKESPRWWYWAIGAAMIAIPLMAMLSSSLRGKDPEPVLAAIPLYAICGTVLMMTLSVMIIVLVMLVLTYLLIRTVGMFLGEGTLERDTSGRYVYAFPDGTKSLFNRFSW